MTEQEEYKLPEACANVKPMTEWIELPEEDGTCRPCILPIALAWYTQELEEAGHHDLAAQLQEVEGIDNLTPLQVAEKLDKIKDSVDSSLRTRLQELDCTVQVNAQTLSIEEKETETNNV